MKKSSKIFSLILVLLITIAWFAGSWWYYSCKLKKTCKNLELNSLQSSTPVIDSDSDGLSDSEEQNLGTDPNSNDSDQDGTPDNEEVGGIINAPLDTDQDGIIDALDSDDDNDGLPSLLERKIGTNPLLVDSDQDGFSDSEEIGSNPSQPIDTDGDGINNALDTDDDDDGILTSEEILLGTNFLLNDSDGDGLSDSVEIGDFIEKPLDSDQDGIIDALDSVDNNSDLDNDGLTDLIEISINTDPNNPDTDGDGKSDFEEVGDNYKLPLDSDLDGIIDAIDTTNDNDSDNDGINNIQEQQLGSNPNSADSDNDGISDKIEIGTDINNPLDTDNDGILNIIDTDDDNDGLSTKYETQIGTNPIVVDSNNNGISDYDEQKSLNKHINKQQIQNNKNSVSIQEFGKPNTDINSFQKARIYFPSRSKKPELTKEAAIYFTSVVNWMKKNPNKRILLIGHTDDVGSEKANLALGLKRVITIRKFLIDHGASFDQIKIISKGEAEPIAPNNTKEGRFKNRRVEIGTYSK